MDTLIRAYQAAIHERVWKSRLFPPGRKGELALLGGYVMDYLLKHCDDDLYCPLKIKEICNVIGFTPYKLRKSLSVLENIQMIHYVSKGIAVIPLDKEHLQVRENIYMKHIKIVTHRDQEQAALGGY